MACGVARAAVSRARTGRSSSRGPAVRPASRSLVTVDPATGAQQVLGPGAEPACSADGAKLAFVRNRRRRTSPRRTAAARAAVGAGDFPAWSPDGGRLVVSRSDGTASAALRSRPRGRLGRTADRPSPSTRPCLPGRPTARRSHSRRPAGSRPSPAAGGAATPVSLPEQRRRRRPVVVARRALCSRSSTRAAQVWVTRARRQRRAAGHATRSLRPASGAAAARVVARRRVDRVHVRGRISASRDLAGAVRASRATQQTAASVARLAPRLAARDERRRRDRRGAAGRERHGRLRLEPRRRASRCSTPTSRRASSARRAAGGRLREPPRAPADGDDDDARRARDGRPRRASIGFATQPGEYEYTVTGYPDGVPRRGSFVVDAAGHVTAEPHAPIRYGVATVLTGGGRRRRRQPSRSARARSARSELRPSRR